MTPEKGSAAVDVAAVVAAVLVLGFAAFLVVKPDREACKTAIGAEVDTMLANDKPIEQWEEPNADELRARVSWPCRFQSDAQLEAIGREVFSERFPEIMTRAFTQSRPRERKSAPALIGYWGLQRRKISGHRGRVTAP